LSQVLDVGIFGCKAAKKPTPDQTNEAKIIDAEVKSGMQK